MNDEIFKVDLLGKLKIDEIFYYYEEPQLFSCVSAFENKYLGMLTDSDEREWLIIPISSSRLALLRSNKISVREAIINLEDDFVWQVKESIDNSLKIAKQVYIGDLKEEDLPDNDLYLNCENTYMPNLDDDIIKTSIDEHRDIIDISLLPLNRHIKELEFQTLGEVLVNIQQVIYSIALDKEFKGNRISNKVKEDNSLSAAGTYAASFGIRAKSNKLSDLYNETPLTKNINKFTQLLKVKDNKEELKKLLRQMNPRVSMRYKKLMQCLLKENISFNISLASPNSYSFKTEFTEKDVENNLKYLLEDFDNNIVNEKARGELFGINIKRKRFWFQTFDDEIIEGNISDELLEAITFEVPINAEITLEKETILNELTDEEKYKYKLISISMLNGN